MGDVFTAGKQRFFVLVSLVFLLSGNATVYQ